MRYALVVGDSWGVALDWRQAFPGEPFLGVRFDGHEAWVLFEPKTVYGPVCPSALCEIRRAFEAIGDAWIDEDVFIHQAPTLASCLRLARHVVCILRSDASTDAER